MTGSSGPSGVFRAAPDHPPLRVDANGLTLGPDWPLVRRTTNGFRRVDEIDGLIWLLRFVLDSDIDPRRFAKCLDGVAEDLASGQMAKARGTALALTLAIPPLDAAQRRRMRLASALLRKDYNPDQPRGQDGRWSSSGDAAPSGTEGVTYSLHESAMHVLAEAFPFLDPETIAQAPARLASAAETAAQAGAETASQAGLAVAQGGGKVLSFVARLGGGVLGAIPLTLIPDNKNSRSTGTLPLLPDYRYEYDEGRLSIYRDGPELGKPVFSGAADADGFFHDASGQLVGRASRDGFVLAPDYVVRLMAAAAQLSETRPKSVASASEDGPRLCPAPSPDKPGGKLPPAIAYQMQISGLPEGLAVKLGGVTFDGCRLSDGVMLEAKGPGYEKHMIDPKTWKEWYTGMDEAIKQAERQSKAAMADGRRVEWHVAEPKVAAFLKAALETAHSNITVIHTPALMP